MKRVLLMLVAGTVLTGFAAAYASTLERPGAKRTTTPQTQPGPRAG